MTNRQCLWTLRCVLISAVVVAPLICLGDTNQVNSTGKVLNSMNNNHLNKSGISNDTEQTTAGQQETSGKQPEMTHHHLPHVPTEAAIKRNWTNILLYRNYSNGTLHAHGLRTRCRLSTTDQRASSKLQDLLISDTALVEYTFEFSNYSGNPLSNNSYLGYQSHVWSRIVSPQGQTILNLAFNYDIMSLMTLSFGIQKVSLYMYTLRPHCQFVYGPPHKTNIFTC